MYSTAVRMYALSVAMIAGFSTTAGSGMGGIGIGGIGSLQQSPIEMLGIGSSMLMLSGAGSCGIGSVGVVIQGMGPSRQVDVVFVSTRATAAGNVVRVDADTVVAALEAAATAVVSAETGGTITILAIAN